MCNWCTRLSISLLISDQHIWEAWFATLLSPLLVQFPYSVCKIEVKIKGEKLVENYQNQVDLRMTQRHKETSPTEFATEHPRHTENNNLIHPSVPICVLLNIWLGAKQVTDKLQKIKNNKKTQCQSLYSGWERDEQTPPSARRQPVVPVAPWQFFWPSSILCASNLSAKGLVIKFLVSYSP